MAKKKIVLSARAENRRRKMIKELNVLNESIQQLIRKLDSIKCQENLVRREIDILNLKRKEILGDE
jgi:hypothetical protein